MITVIDMTSGELICSSAATQIKNPVSAHENELPMLALAQQEVQPEAIVNAIPPEFADIPVAAILARFE